MVCRSCGTTIADKAIVCFRCGVPTDLPAPVRPAPANEPRPPWPAVLLVLIAAVGSLAAALTLAEPDAFWRVPAMAGAAVLLVVAVVLLWRFRVRRHRIN